MKEAINDRDALLHQHLEDLVSYEHGDCSIAASQANYEVNQLFEARFRIDEGDDGRPDDLQLYPLGENDHSYNFKAYIIDAPQAEMEVDGESLKLVFARPVRLIEEPVEEEVDSPSSISQESIFMQLGRKAFTPREPKKIIKTVTKEKLQEPELGALIGKDVFMPLVGFRYRAEHGACSYIQVGLREMNDDSYVVTPFDEKGWRHVVVEGVRDLIGGRELDPSGEKYETFHEFAAREFGLYKDTLVEKRESEFVRRSFDWIEESEKDIDELLAVNESDERVEKIENLKGLQRYSRLRLPGGGREVRFELARDRAEKGSRTAALYAVTRHNLALPLIKIDEGSPSVNYPVVGDRLSEDSRLYLMRSLGSLLGRKEYEQDAPENLRSNPKIIKGQGHKSFPTSILKPGSSIEGVALDAFVASALWELGLVHEKEKVPWEVDNPDYKSGDRNSVYVWEFKHGELRNFDEEGVQLTKVELKNFVDKPWRVKVPSAGLDTRSMQLALHRIKQITEGYEKVAGMLDVSSRFEELLGETDEEQEILFETILELAAKGEPVKAVLHDLPFKETRGSLEFVATASSEGTGAELVVTSRPIGMPEAAKADYVKITCDKLLPLFKNSSTRNHSPSEYAAIVNHLLINRMGVFD